mgnify:CR=1 FL=1
MIVLKAATVVVVFFGGMFVGILLLAMLATGYANAAKAKRAAARKQRNGGSVSFTDLPQEWRKVQ